MKYRILVILSVILIVFFIGHNCEVIRNTVSYLSGIIYAQALGILSRHRCSDDIIKCHDGSKTFFCYRNDSVVCTNLRAGIPWEGFIHRYFRMLSDHNRVALDIGANIGTHTVYLSELFHRVHAFEPQAGVHGLLVRNVSINGCTNVACHNFGLGDRDGVAVMQHFDPDKMVNRGGIGIFGEGGEGEVVSIRSLDGMDLGDIGLMKIDVEGYEYNVLSGAERTIRRCRPVIVIELNRKSRKDHDRIRLFFNRLGYIIRRISMDDYLASPGCA